MTFIISEEEALKALLSGITVEDAGNPARPVAVFYGQPDKEIRAQVYPYITIDLVGISEDTSRAHRGVVNITSTSNYIPEGVTVTGDGLKTNFPIPVDLYYQVSTWSRTPRHDRQLVAKLFALGRLPFRFGQLSIPQDGTNRRLDMLGFTKRDVTENDKRLFNNIYNIRISAEIFEDALVQMYKVTQQPTISTTYQTIPFSTITQ